MKKRNVKLLVSGLTLGLAALTTVGSTYAWFTTNGNATVSGMDITAEGAGEGIFVSSNGGDSYGRAVTLTDKFTDNVLKPVTSLDGATFSQLSSDVFATNDTNDVFSYVKVDNAKGYYVSFDLHFAVTKGSEIKIQANDFKSASEDAKEILTVARMSVAVYSTTGDSDDTRTFNENPDEAKIYTFANKDGELNDDVALKQMNTLYGKNVTDKSFGIYKGSSTSTGSETDVLDVVTVLGADATDFVSSDNTYAAVKDGTKSLAIAGVEGEFEYAKVHFNFWIEGNDKLCSNKVIAQSLSGSLTFTATPKGA